MSHVSEALVAFRAWAALTASNNSSAFSIIGPLIVSRRRSSIQINATAYMRAMRNAPQVFESRDRMRRVRRWCAEFDAKSGQKNGTDVWGNVLEGTAGQGQITRPPLSPYATSVLQHASAVHFGTKRRQAPAFIAHYTPDGARELAQLRAELQAEHQQLVQRADEDYARAQQEHADKPLCPKCRA